MYALALSTLRRLRQMNEYLCCLLSQYAPRGRFFYTRNKFGSYLTCVCCSVFFLLFLEDTQRIYQQCSDDDA